jgi:Na+/H+ antiporter NhaC
MQYIKHITWLIPFFYCMLFSVSGQCKHKMTIGLHDGAFILEHPGVEDGKQSLSVNGAEQEVVFQDDRAAILLGEVSTNGSLYFIKHVNYKSHVLYHIQLAGPGDYRIKKIPLWLSIVPPLIAILMALLLKEVLIALFTGIWAGAFIACGLSLTALLRSFVYVVEKYVIEALTDASHMAVIVFSLLIGGMVAIISKNGGMAGVVHSLSKYAKTRSSAQFITWVLGVAIFFDDYANTLIVGNTMRSVTDRFRVSREKLAYIVDSTAAPVAAIAFITTWIGAELGYIDDGMASIRSFDLDMTPYSIFIQSLKYSFYPALTLIFILFIIKTGKDYGPMLIAERRAHNTGQLSGASNPSEDEPNMEDLSPIPGVPIRPFNAVIPVLIVIMVTILGLLITGMNATATNLYEGGFVSINADWLAIWQNMDYLLGDDAGFLRKMGKIIGNADSFTALLWASFCGASAAIFLSISQKLMRLFDTMHYLVVGFKTMIPAVLILTLAWSLAITTEELYTAEFLSSLLEGNLNPVWMPVVTFILAALISFSTGSSWSTMAILYPIAIPTSWAVSQAHGLPVEESFEILLNVISVVLAASVLGDHCSPISDTTILSSLASDCNHIDHVRTQLPYALTVGGVSIIACGLASYLGGGWLICGVIFLLSILVLWIIVNKKGQSLLLEN